MAAAPRSLSPSSLLQVLFAYTSGLIIGASVFNGATDCLSAPLLDAEGCVCIVLVPVMLDADTDTETDTEERGSPPPEMDDVVSVMDGDSDDKVTGDTLKDVRG